MDPLRKTIRPILKSGKNLKVKALLPQRLVLKLKQIKPKQIQPKKIPRTILPLLLRTKDPTGAPVLTGTQLVVAGEISER